MKCEYCGNTSGLKQERGGCISCGGFSELKEPNKPISTNRNLITESGITEVRAGRGNQLLYIYYTGKSI